MLVRFVDVEPLDWLALESLKPVHTPLQLPALSGGGGGGNSSDGVSVEPALPRGLYFAGDTLTGEAVRPSAKAEYLVS